MKIIDANELQATTTLNADICIVGAGAAGITVASELDGTSQTVCLIESGGYGPDEDTQALYDLEIVWASGPRELYVTGQILWGNL